jgi:hypothetical protein
MTSENGAQAAAAAAGPDNRISYGLRIFAASPDGFIVEIVADEEVRPMEWLTRTLDGLKRQNFVPVDPFPAPTINLAAAPPIAQPAPAERRGPPPGGGGRQNGPGGRQGGRPGGGNRGGGQNNGGRNPRYVGEEYYECPWCRGEIFDNRKQKEAGTWKGGYYACKDRECGWVVWKSDGTYQE